MANNIAFQPMGKTYLLSLPAASTAVTIAVTADSPSQQYEIYNPTTSPIFYTIKGTSTPAVIPDVNGQYSQACPPGSRVVVTGPQCSTSKTVYVSAICGTASASIYVTPGEGLS